jgi:hypothetical protein
MQSCRRSTCWISWAQAYPTRPEVPQCKQPPETSGFCRRFRRPANSS